MTKLTYLVNLSNGTVKEMTRYADVITAMERGALSYQKRYSEVKPKETYRVTMADGNSLLVESYMSARRMVKACKGAKMQRVQQ